MVLTIAEEELLKNGVCTCTAGDIQHGLSYYGVWHVLSSKIGNGGISNVLAISSFEPLIPPLQLNVVIVLAI